MKFKITVEVIKPGEEVNKYPQTEEIFKAQFHNLDVEKLISYLMAEPANEIARPMK